MSMGLPGTTFATFEVVARPATYSTAGELDWKAAVQSALADQGAQQVPTGLRLHVTIEFRLRAPSHAGEFWDIDNLVKPTMDAMGAVLGYRDWRGRSQAQDDRVDSLLATKRTIREGETEGAGIEVRWLS